MNKSAIFFAAVSSFFMVPANACPTSECLPESAKEAFESRDLVEFYDLRQPGQATLHVSKIGSDYTTAVLAAEARAFRLAALTGEKPDFSSLKFFPRPESLFDALNSDLLQVEVTGRMPQLRHFEQRVLNADARAQLADAGRKLEFESGIAAALKQKQAVAK